MTKSILVVDDEEVVVDITTRKLMQEGFEVIGASDGLSALEVLRQRSVDLILLDVEMPGMNGYTFMSERTKIPGGDRPSVIILTAYDSMESIFRRHGVRVYLVKPLRFSDLLVKVREVLDAPPAPAAA